MAFRLSFRGLAAVTFVATSACQGPPPQVPSGSATSASAKAGEGGPSLVKPARTAPVVVTLPPLSVVDPMEVVRDRDGLQRFCRNQIEAARTRIEAVAARAEDPEPARWETTFGLIDEARLALANAAEPAALIGTVSGDAAVREVAASCEAEALSVEASLGLDGRLVAALDRAATQLSSPNEEQRRFVDWTLLDLRRRGARLDAAGKERLRALDTELVASSQAFLAALTSSRPSIRVPASELVGTSEAFRRAHPPGADGKVRIGVEPEDSHEFISYARNRKLARELYVKLVNRGGDANVARLDRLLALRHEKARLLGFASWADYVTADLGAGSSASVVAFLDRVEAAIAPEVTREADELREELVRKDVSGPWATLSEVDRGFLVERLRTRRHRVDASQVATYFELDSVTRGGLALLREGFGLAFEEVAVTTWHESVRTYDVSRGGMALGRVYLDLVSRTEKPAEMATFAVRTRARLRDGRVQLPAVAVVGRMPEPGAPMSHRQVQMLLHELGHVVQQLVTTNELASFAGTHVPRDVVEAPAMVFEEWAWSRPVLERLVRHHATKKPPPPGWLDALVASRRVGVALDVSRQLLLARLDLALHSTPPPFDSNDLVRAIQQKHSPFAVVEGTHPQSSFAHLVGYDAAYYGYPWSQALARAAASRFPSDRAPATDILREFETSVLGPGGARDPRASWRAFLGREPDEQALIDFVRGR